jgi:hypothetical protein
MSAAALQLRAVLCQWGSRVKVEKPDVVVRARASYVYSPQKADK